MRKLAAIAWLTAMASVVTPVSAHDDKEKNPSCCAVKGEMDCAATYARLTLTADQKAKMDALVEKCKGAGCTKESTAAFIKEAEAILTNEQRTTFKTECAKARAQARGGS